MAANLQLIVSGVDKASGVLKDIDKNAGGLGNTMSTVVKAGFLAGAAGIGIATFAGIKFVKAAMEEEASLKRLQAAVVASGHDMENWGDNFDEFVRTGEKLAFSDDQIRESLTLLTAATGDYDEAQRRSRIAMDFSRGAGIDLATASKLLGKVTDENVTALARYGIKVEEGADATVLLEEVQRRFAGQSEAFADSAAGKWAQFGNQLDNLKESIGKALLPVATALGGVLVDITTAAIPKIEALTKKLVELVTPAVTEGIGILKGQFTDFKDTLETIATSSTFKAFLDGINEGLGNVGEIAMGAKDTVVKAFSEIDTIFKNVPGLSKLSASLGTASKDTENAKNIGKIMTEATAGIIAFSIATSALDTSINIIGNSMGALAGVATTGMAIFLAPNPFLLFLAAVALIVAALVALELKTQFFSKTLYPVLRDDVLPVLEEVGSHFQKLAEFWIPLVAEASVTLKQGWEDLQPAIKPTVEFLANVLGPVFERIGEFLKEHPILITALIASIILVVAPWLAVWAVLILVLAKWDEIKAMFTVTIPAAIDSVITKVKEIPVLGEIFTGTMNAIWIIVSTVFALIRVHIETTINVIRDVLQVVTALIHGDWNAAWQGIKQLAFDIWEGIKAVVSIALTGLKDLIWNQLTTIAGIIADIWRPIGNVLKGPFEDARDAVNWLIRRIEALIEIINRIPSPRDIVPDIPSLPSIPNVPGNPFNRNIGGQEGAPSVATGGAPVIVQIQPMYMDGTPAQAEQFGEAVYNALEKRMRYA